MTLRAPENTIAWIAAARSVPWTGAGLRASQIAFGFQAEYSVSCVDTCVPMRRHATIAAVMAIRFQPTTRQ